MKPLTLIKVGGAELQPGPILEYLVATLAHWTETHTLVVVHGGGKDIATLQQELGLEPRFVEGLRVTDKASLRVAEMTLSGTVNKRLTGQLVIAGVSAIGISGVDGGLLRAKKLIHPAGDLGRVGEITEVNTQFLTGLVDQGLTPVVSPISLGYDGEPFNVNADHAALAIAGALHVDEMVYLTDVPGVMQEEGAVLPTLSAQAVIAMIDDGTIHGGMIPKVRSALAAIEAGVSQVRITNLDGLALSEGTLIGQNNRYEKGEDGENEG